MQHLDFIFGGRMLAWVCTSRCIRPDKRSILAVQFEGRDAGDAGGAVILFADQGEAEGAALQSSAAAHGRQGIQRCSNSQEDEVASLGKIISAGSRCLGHQQPELQDLSQTSTPTPTAHTQYTIISMQGSSSILLHFSPLPSHIVDEI